MKKSVFVTLLVDHHHIHFFSPSEATGRGGTRTYSENAKEWWLWSIIVPKQEMKEIKTRLIRSEKRPSYDILIMPKRPRGR
jgi:hypothetical protein